MLYFMWVMFAHTSKGLAMTKHCRAVVFQGCLPYETDMEDHVEWRVAVLFDCYKPSKTFWTNTDGKEEEMPGWWEKSLRVSDKFASHHGALALISDLGISTIDPPIGKHDTKGLKMLNWHALLEINRLDNLSKTKAERKLQKAMWLKDKAKPAE